MIAPDLPLPPAPRNDFSRTSILPACRRAKCQAMLVPITPPPITTMSALSLMQRYPVRLSLEAAHSGCYNTRVILYRPIVQRFVFTPIDRRTPHSKGELKRRHQERGGHFSASKGTCPQHLGERP